MSDPTAPGVTDSVRHDVPLSETLKEGASRQAAEAGVGSDGHLIHDAERAQRTEEEPLKREGDALLTGLGSRQGHDAGERRDREG